MTQMTRYTQELIFKPDKSKLKHRLKNTSTLGCTLIPNLILKYAYKF